MLRQHMNSVITMITTPAQFANAWFFHLPRSLPFAQYSTKNAMMGSRMAFAA